MSSENTDKSFAVTHIYKGLNSSEAASYLFSTAKEAIAFAKQSYLSFVESFKDCCCAELDRENCCARIESSDGEIIQIYVGRVYE